MIGDMARYSAQLTTLLLGGLIVTLAGCAPAAPVSAQPDVDAAVLADLPDDYASVLTELDAESSECLTTITLLPQRYGLTGFMIEDTITLLREGGKELDCQPVLHVVDDDGRQVTLDHLVEYFPVEAREGDLVIN